MAEGQATSSPAVGEHSGGWAQIPGENGFPAPLRSGPALDASGYVHRRPAGWLGDPSRLGRIPWRARGQMPRGTEDIPREDKAQEASTLPPAGISRTPREKSAQRRGARRSRTSRGRGSHSGLRSAGEGTAFSTASPSRAPPTTAAEPAAHRKPLRSAAQAHRATPPRPGLGPDGTCPLGWGASGETSSSLLRGSLPA